MFRLALALGMTVAELGQRMSSVELSEWAVFFELEPLDADSEWRAGLVASTIANVNRDPKKLSRAFSPEDFMRPSFIVDEKKESDKSSLSKKITIAMMALGGEVQNGDSIQADC